MAPVERDLRVWVVSEASAGTLNQALGLAEALNPQPVVKIIRQERWLKRLISPFRQDPDELEPDVIVSCGRISEQFVQTIKNAYASRPFAVHLQRPSPETDCYDMIFVSQQGWLPDLDGQARYHPMLGVPSRINLDDVVRKRTAARARWATRGSRIVTLLVGGPNKAFRFDESTGDTIISTVKQLIDQSWIILTTVSRRTPAAVARQLSEIKHPNFVLWASEGPNPYHEYMAAADAFVVTQDSVAMVSEAATTGMPVYILHLDVIDSAKARNFIRFHEDLEQRGITRRYDGHIDDYSYEPLNETARIAEIIRLELKARG